MPSSVNKGSSEPLASPWPNGTTIQIKLRSLSIKIKLLHSTIVFITKTRLVGSDQKRILSLNYNYFLILLQLPELPTLSTYFADMGKSRGRGRGRGGGRGGRGRGGDDDDSSEEEYVRPESKNL